MAVRDRWRAVRVGTAAVLGLVLAALLAAPTSGAPLPVRDLRLADVAFQTVNISFNVSLTPDVDHYIVYVSRTNGSTVDELRPAPGQPNTTYDTLFVTSPQNASGMAAWTSRVGWFAYDNGTTGNWTVGRVQAPWKFIPSDAGRVFYSITGLEAEVRHYVAVTPVNLTGVENRNITTVAATPIAAPVETLPSNEAILYAFGGIIFALVAALLALWRTSGAASRPAYAYVGPAIVALAALTFYPTAVGIFLSFTDRTLTSGRGGFDYHFIGLDNYVRVFSRPEFPLVAATTIVWTVANVFLHVTVGLALAVLLNRKIRARPIYRTLFLFPWAVPSYISIIAWRGMFEGGGLVDTLFGHSVDWLHSMPWALIAVITANVWLGIPFMMMVFSGGLQGIPEDLYEAADVDGLSRFQKFRRITLPLLKPTIVPASLLGFIWTFNMFNVIYLMTQGTPTVAIGVDANATDILITYVYREGFAPFWRQGFAAAYSVVIFFMLMAFSLSYTRYTRAMESLAGERVPRAKGSIARVVDRVFAPLTARLLRPLVNALKPDQPETVDPSWIPGALLAIGLFEFSFGMSTHLAMGSWYTPTAVHGLGLAFIGGLAIVSGALLAGRRSSGRRLGVWVGIFDLAAAVLSSPWTPWVSLFRFAWTLILLGLLVRPMAALRPQPDAYSLADKVGDAWTRLAAKVPGGPALRFAERVSLHGFLIIFAVWSILPVLVVVGTAFSDVNAMSSSNIPIFGPFIDPTAPVPTWTAAAFDQILGRRCGSGPSAPLCFPLWLTNSLIVSTGTTLWGLAVVLPAAYGFSRFEFRGKRSMMLSFLLVQMFPGAIILIPYYLLMQQLRLLNNPLGLILAYSVTALPFMVWMLKGFFDTIPRDLEEAAMVDGTSRTGAFVRVILPLSLPALAVTALFSFLSAWNEWLLAFTFMSNERNFTLPVGISSLAPQGPGSVFWNQYAALSLIVSIPVIILFIVFQRYMISGLTKGAVKG